MSQNPETGEVTYTVKDPDSGNYPEGATVTINGHNYQVTGGTVTVPNDNLPEATRRETPKVQESGKLPKTANEVEVPAKLVEAEAATVTFKQDPTSGEVTVKVTKENGTNYPNGTKVKVPGNETEYTVGENGSFTIANSDLPGENQTGTVTVTETGHKPQSVEGTTPARLTSAKGEPAKEFEVAIPLPLVVPNPEHLTPQEIEKLVGEVKKSNPNSDVTADDKGNITVTDKTTGESVLIPVKDLTVKDFTPVKPTDKVPVKDKVHLTPEEKKQVEDKVKAQNPGKDVMVGEDGTVTVTDPNTGISHTIPGTELVNQDFEPVKPTDKVPVQDKVHLTPEEKQQVADKVKVKNPGKDVTVGDDGTATVADPTTGISHKIPGTELVNQDFAPVKPTDKIPVKDKGHLTLEEKKQVADKVKAKNPGKDVTVGEDGTATVMDPTTGISHEIPGTELVNQDFTPVKPTDKVPVKDKAHLTPEEKKQVADKVKAQNPGKDVTVGDDGTATVTDPTTGISHTIPGTELVNQDFTPVKPTDKVPVKDKKHLTPEEKKQVADKVKAKNPGKDVTVGEDGTVMVTDPTTGISHEIPGTELVNQDFEPMKPTEKVPVKDKAQLTPEEKKQVADKVKAQNPGKNVTVGDDGTATVTDPTTGVSHTIPGTELVNQDFEPVKPTDKVAVKDLNNLTKDEQDKVKKSVEKVNPGKTVVVEPTGKVTITDPKTKLSHELSGDEVTTVLPPVLEVPEYTGPVGTPGVDGNGNLIEPPVEEIPEFNGGVNGEPEVQPVLPEFNGAVNGEPEVQPELPEYTGPIGTPGVAENGNLITPPVVEIPEFNGGVNGELPDSIELPKVKLIITKWTDEEDNELKSADVKVPAVLGEANEALEAGEIEGYVFVRTEVKDDVVTHIFRKVTPSQPNKPEGSGEDQGEGNKPQPTPTSPKVDENIKQATTAKVQKSTKRLANTGEAETNTGLAGLGLAVLGSLLAVVKRRKKDEE